ncbi:transcriptional regulator [Nitrosopumilus sp.]|uniref:transcriptional regulator n=1 Tax=Nitrosopumilus sp. TaxID=2024843 RepID=UPI00247BD0FA|nr:transcriptional regulator [Nitrosopumilus sp.]MCV0430208.1 transcriptional regulator [Nitrosopumilus sp.]
MENGLDNLLVPSLRKSIEENLGKETLNKIEDRLMERHGLGLVQAIKNFHKFDSVLREFFGAGADGLEQKFLQKIVDIEQSKQSVSNWVSIKDPELSKVFLESFADQDKKAILGSVMDESLIIAKILETCKIPQTSGYRKINYLINNGLLVSNGFELAHDGKKVKKYETIFDNVKVDIVKNNVAVKIQLKKSLLAESSIIQTVQISC